MIYKSFLSIPIRESKLISVVDMPVDSVFARFLVKIIEGMTSFFTFLPFTRDLVTRQSDGWHLRLLGKSILFSQIIYYNS